jgi:hypothetical protein
VLSAVDSPVEQHRDRDRSRANGLGERAVWTAAGLVCTLTLDALWVIGVLTTVLGLRIYWWHGRAQITAAGLYSFATAVFVGMSAMWWDLESVPPPGMLRAAEVGFWVLLTMSWFWKDRPFPRLMLPAGSDRHTGWAATFGVTASFALTGLVLWRGEDSPTVLTQVILGCMGVLACALVLHRTRRNHSVRRLWLAAVVVMLFTQFVFSGYGRLNLVALGFNAIITASMLATNRLLKSLTILGVGPAMVVFTLMRQHFILATYGAQQDGPGSVMTPLRDFAGLTRLGDQHVLAHSHGDTFFATAVFWVPRSLWADKPVGLGTELTKLLHPDLLSVGQSLAALNQGEWFFDFGWIGVIAMVPVIGLLIRLLDDRLCKVLAHPVSTRRRLVAVLILVTLMSDVPNLMWVGSFGYISRVTLRLVPLLVMLAAATDGPVRKDKDHPPTLVPRWPTRVEEPTRR